MLKVTGTCTANSLPPSYLSEGLTQLSQDALLIKHLPLVAVLIVIMDALPHVCWELVERHILFHLFVLCRGERKRRSHQDMRQMVPAHGQAHARLYPYLLSSHPARPRQINLVQGRATVWTHGQFLDIFGIFPKWLPHVLTFKLILSQLHCGDNFSFPGCWAAQVPVFPYTQSKSWEQRWVRGAQLGISSQQILLSEGCPNAVQNESKEITECPQEKVFPWHIAEWGPGCMTWQLGSRPVSDVQHLEASAKHRNSLYQGPYKTAEHSSALDVHSHKLKDTHRQKSELLSWSCSTRGLLFLSSVLFLSAPLWWHFCFPTWGCTGPYFLHLLLGLYCPMHLCYLTCPCFYLIICISIMSLRGEYKGTLWLMQSSIWGWMVLSMNKLHFLKGTRL